MTLGNLARLALLTGVILSATACGRIGGFFGGNNDGVVPSESSLRQRENIPEQFRGNRPSIFNLFLNTDDPNVTLEVNKYIWNASLDVLDFLPIEAADPFSGVLVFGYGTPPGGGRAYKATVYIQDPALDARSLRVALLTRGGGAAPIETTRALEDAILTRARQLRIAEGNR